MRWGLVSLNGKVDDVQKLSLQLKKYTQQAEFNRSEERRVGKECSYRW